MPENEVAVIGGGLGGLITAILLRRAGYSVVLFERKFYPFHRVCGEYISNETVPFLKSEGLYPDHLVPEQINHLQLTSVNGKDASVDLDLGGFGVSRFSFDEFLYKKALADGVLFHCGEEVTDVALMDGVMRVTSDKTTVLVKLVIGAFGKRSRIDHQMKRDFISRRSPYIGVKYHIRYNHPTGLIALHNFKDGYCGISNVEGGITNLCYLSHRSNLKTHGSVRRMEEEVMWRNPFIKRIFQQAEFLFEKPEVINEISFATKQPVENHVLMVGDSAGMITPLCGNGMALAIHSAKIASEWSRKFLAGEVSREELEKKYSADWKKHFATRLWAGRQIQRLFGSERMSDIAVAIARNNRPITNYLISKTHGNPF